MYRRAVQGSRGVPTKVGGRGDQEDESAARLAGKLDCHR